MECAGLSIERRSEPWGVTYAMRGELDVLSAATAEVVIGDDLRVGVGDVALDLGALEFVDLGSLLVLERLARGLAARGRRMELVRTNRIVDRALDVAGSSLLAMIAPPVDTSSGAVARHAPWDGSDDRAARHVAAGAVTGPGGAAGARPRGR